MIRERPQVIILASVDDSHFGLWLYRWCRLPFIVFTYGNEVLDVINTGQNRQQLALSLARRVLATSRYTARISQEAGARPERIEVVWPGCHTDFFQPRPVNNDFRERILAGRHAGRVILTVGNLVARKGQDMVIRALPALCREIPDLVYIIVGGGPYRSELENLARELEVFDRIVFAGRVPDEDLPDLYALCDVFVMVSRERIDENDVEGFGIVMLEANACGKPVVGGRSGGVPDAVAEGVSGLLVDPLNPSEIAEALARLLTDREFATRLGEQGRLRVLKEFQWRGVGVRVREVLKSVHSETAMRR